MFGFTIVWLGQLVSVLTTGMSGFALTIWVYEKTGSATALGLMQVFFITPFLVISPIAGAMVDRYNRKLMMMVSDLMAGVATLGLLALQGLGVLEVWHLYVAAIFQGLGNAFQWPAFSAAISTLVSKEQYGRANGMMSLMEAGPQVIAPLLAGALLPFVGLTGILVLDVATFVVAVLALLVIHVPQPRRTEEGQRVQGNLLKEAAFGFQYIFSRPSLLGLQLVFFTGNLMANLGFTVIAAMILARTGNNELTLGSLQTIGALGGVAGGIVMSKRRVHGVLLGWIIGGFFSQTLLGLGQSWPVWAIGAFVGFGIVPLVNGSNQAIWQAKVPPDLQGRVFAARRLIAWFTGPIAPLIAGPLADFVLEPAMRGGGTLSSTFGGMVGTGPGAGMALLLVITGALASLVGVLGYFVPVVRDTLAPAKSPEVVTA
jgi:MFS family permease